ncbi:MAG: RNase adapter RapZ [Myxococcota bacterium]
MTTRARDADLVVVTGLSGAGKTTALNALEDAGCYCIDNLPPPLIAATVDACRDTGIERVALGIDVRVGAFLDAIQPAIEAQAGRPGGLYVLYLDAADEAVVRRFHETRRPHPVLADAAPGSGVQGDEENVVPSSVSEGVRLERARLAGIRTAASEVVDTTHLTVHQLRRMVLERFSGDGEASRLQVRLLSFGFKHGVPLDANLVFDVRFLDNPYFVPGLREATGNDEAVRDHVLASDGAEAWLGHVEALLKFSLPRYEAEGKTYLTVAIGCTGGRHRSVALSVELARRLSTFTGQRIGILHRDVTRGAVMTEVKASP